MAADRPLPIRAGHIRLDAPYFPRFVVQTLGPTSEIDNDIAVNNCQICQVLCESFVVVYCASSVAFT